MRNLPFVIWMVAYLPAANLTDYLAFLANGSVVQHYSADVEGAAALIVIGVWLGVGALLYRRSP